jgi:alpha-L-fucosidase 2
LHQIFEAISSASSNVGETETTFVSNITITLASLDKGLHIRIWGEVRGQKIQNSLSYHFENGTHRHLSNLVGWYPGYSSSSLLGGYANAAIQKAVTTSLYSRSLGNGPDANGGWEKIWRSACWARLNNTDLTYLELKYAINTNFANNRLSMYTALDPPCQIGANFGLAGAMLSMLIVDLPMLNSDTGVHTIVLVPAIPAAWAGGEAHALVLRGGGYVDFYWDSQGLVIGAIL